MKSRCGLRDPVQSFRNTRANCRLAKFQAAPCARAGKLASSASQLRQISQLASKSERTGSYPIAGFGVKPLGSSFYLGRSQCSHTQGPIRLKTEHIEIREGPKALLFQFSIHPNLAAAHKAPTGMPVACREK